MDVLIFCFVLLALTAYVARPLYERGRLQSPSPTAGETEARHRVIVRALSDLEIDRASGLYTAPEYDAERAALQAQEAEIAPAPRNPTD